MTTKDTELLNMVKDFMQKYIESVNMVMPKDYDHLKEAKKLAIQMADDNTISDTKKELFLKMIAYLDIHE
jgi:hypothetical protein